MHKIDELMRCGSGLTLVFVANGQVESVHTIYSYEHPEDLIQTKDAMEKLVELGQWEVISKQNLREEREKKATEGNK